MTSEIILVETTVDKLIVNEQKSLDIIEIGIQGPPGIAGTSGNTVVQVIAGEAIGGGRVVKHDSNKAYYASSDNFDDMDKVIGITTGAVILNAILSVQTATELVDSSWSWNIGPIFVGLNGVMTQTPPVNGFVLQVAIAISATKIIVNIKQGILRS